MTSTNIIMPTTPNACDPRSKLLRLEEELKRMYFEREELIRVILLSLLTRQHTLIFGKHGAAKSSLTRSVSSAISCGFFGIQLGKDTTRDEVFGPIKVSQLPNDRLCRAYEQFLPGKPIVFLDEIDKANSIIQNSLYTAMEGRLFLDDGVMRSIPLISVFGAANSITQFQTDALALLLDRFLFRFEVDWLQSDQNFLEFIRRKAEQDSPILTTVLSLSELKAMQTAVHSVSFPRTTQEAIAQLRKELASEGIFASDRRWGYIIQILQAVTFFDGDDSVTEDSFAILKHVLWSDRKQVPVIERILQPFAQGLPAKFKQAMNKAIAKADEAMSDQDASTLSGKCALAIADLNGLKEGIGRISQNSRTKRAAKEINQRIEALRAHMQQSLQPISV